MANMIQTTLRKRHNRASTLIQLTAVIIVLAGIAWGAYCFINKAIPVTGRIFVVTQDQSAVQMAGVQVWAMREDVLRGCMTELSSSLTHEFEDFKTRYDAARNDDARLKIWSEWHKRKIQLVVASIQLDDSFKKLNGYFKGKKTQEWWFQTTTDADGRFSLNLPPAAQYAIIAMATRMIGDTSEAHLWHTRIECGHLETFDIKLSNDKDLVFSYAEIREGEDAAFLRLMVERYGLKAPDLD